MDHAALLTLSRDDLITLIEAQAQQVAALTARIAELEAKLVLPPKNPDNSSLPPSKGEKPNLPDPGKKPRPSRPGVARSLAENPDRIIEATLAACPHCDHALAPADMADIHAGARPRAGQSRTRGTTSTCRPSAPSSAASTATAGPAPAAAGP